jgi:monoamine oxidase
MAVGGGADSFRFKDGASAMVRELRMAVTKDNAIRNKLLIDNPHAAATIRTSMQVTELRHRKDGQGVTVTARSSSGGIYTIEAEHVIVATTPTLRNKLLIDGNATSFPPDAMGMGQTIKTFATFNRPWWKEERGASGYALSARNTPDSPVVWTMDNSWREQDVVTHCLMGFIVGARARELAQKTTAERKKIVLSHWSRIFETPFEVIESACTNFSDRDWSTGVSGGCPAAFFKPGQFHAHGPALRRPNGRIHWSGAETATDWVGGYINGALQSGLRAAMET